MVNVSAVIEAATQALAADIPTDGNKDLFLRLAPIVLSPEPDAISNEIKRLVDVMQDTLLEIVLLSEAQGAQGFDAFLRSRKQG